MFLHLLISLPLILTASWIIWSFHTLYLNYLIAKRSKLPFRIIPISHENPIWMVLDKKILNIRIIARFPLGTGSFTRFNWRGWEFADNYRAHEELGDVFMLVTPGRNWVYVCDPVALGGVFRRRGEFLRPLEIFGNIA